MKKLLLILVSLLFIASFTKAADLKGIRVESTYPILVYLDGTQMCSPVYSCFIANLRSGSYRVEVYNARSNRRIFSENIYYNGFRLEEINIDGRRPDHNIRPDHDKNESFQRNHVMSGKEFDKFYNSVVSATFDSEKMSIIDLGLAGNDFTTDQISRLIKLYTFDKDKLPLLKKFYRNAVDKANYYNLLELLDFISSKNELKQYIVDFNK